jgi:VWFA-related protein
MPNASRAALVLLLLSTHFAVAGLHAQSTSAPQPDAAPNSQAPNRDQTKEVYDSSTVLRATTRLVLVDVVARNDKGEPVTALTADDFTVLENGKRQKIRVFSFQQPQAVAGTLLPLPPNVFTNVPRYKRNSALNVILMDGMNTSFEHVAAMRMNTLDFLRKFSRNDPVAIYGLNDKLELLQDFSGGVAPLQDPDKSVPFRAGVTNVSATSFREIPESESKVVRFMAFTAQPQLECFRVQVTLKTLHWIARSLAGYPGRKNLIWLADDFPFNIYTDLGQTTNTCLSRYTSELSETVKTILDNEIAVYPVVAAGLENHDFDVSATVNTFGPVDGQTFGAISGGQLQQLASRTVFINELAAKTGGQAYSNRNDLDMAIRNSIDDGSTYYTLGYYPDDKNWNGEFRSIKVKVDREGIQLHHRGGYFATNTGPVAERSAKSRGHSMSEALSLEAPAATGMFFEASFVPPSPSTGNRSLVKFAVDPQMIAFEKAVDQLEHASLDCVVRVYSPKGALLKTASSTMNAKLSSESFSKVMQSSFPCQQSMDLPAGTYLLRLGVIDNSTGLLGTAAGKITVF